MPVMGLSARTTLSYEGRYSGRERRAPPTVADGRASGIAEPPPEPPLFETAASPRRPYANEPHVVEIDNPLSGLGLLALLSVLIAAVRAGDIVQARRVADMLDVSPRADTGDFEPHFSELRQMLGMAEPTGPRASEAEAGALYNALAEYEAGDAVE